MNYRVYLSQRIVILAVSCIYCAFGMETTGITGNSQWTIPYWKTDRIQGICYSPVPKNIIPSATPWLYDSDMFNTDFQALWGIDPTPGVVSRDDLRYLRNALFNVLHLYDWNPAWYRDHLPFLDYCLILGIGVFIPISNYVFTDGWDQREIIVESIVRSTYNIHGEVHGAVFGWVIGNEYDTHQTDGPGGNPSIPIAKVVEVLMLVARYDPDPMNKRPFTIPCSTAMGYNNNAGPGMGQLAEIRKEMLKYDLSKNIYYNRYMPGLNPFMPYEPGIVEMILEPYKKQAECFGETPLPLIFTETGLSAGDGDNAGKFEPVLGEDGQSYYELEMEKQFVPLMASLNEYNFSGYFFFEFSQEDWKGEGSPDMLYGLHSLGNKSSPVNPHQVSGFWSEIAQEYITNSEYEIQELIPTKAWRAIVALQTNPLLLRSENTENVEISCVLSDWGQATDKCLLYDPYGCNGFTVYTRMIVEQANENAPSCPTNMSMVTQCMNTGFGCRALGVPEAYIFDMLWKGLFSAAMILIVAWGFVHYCLRKKKKVQPDDEESDYGSVTSWQH